MRLIDSATETETPDWSAASEPPTLAAATTLVSVETSVADRIKSLPLMTTSVRSSQASVRPIILFVEIAPAAVIVVADWADADKAADSAATVAVISFSLRDVTVTPRGASSVESPAHASTSYDTVSLPISLVDTATPIDNAGVLPVLAAPAIELAVTSATIFEVSSAVSRTSPSSAFGPATVTCEFSIAARVCPLILLNAVAPPPLKLLAELVLNVTAIVDASDKASISDSLSDVTCKLPAGTFSVVTSRTYASANESIVFRAIPIPTLIDVALDVPPDTARLDVVTDASTSFRFIVATITLPS